MASPLFDDSSSLPHDPHEPHEEEHHHDHGGHVPTEALIALYVFMGLLIGGICREINKKLKIPYTPLLLIFGILIGYQSKELGLFGQSTILMTKIDPHGILMIFIPTLIFESAMNMDWFVFKKAFVNIICLAGPGVLYGAFLLAGVLKYLLGYGDDDLNWPQALTLGSIVCTTDPVAVVALLKELGAPIHLNTLIEGESLLNDGVAMVFFTLFANMARGEVSSAGAVVTNFITLAGGGPILGIIFGLIGTLWLQRIVRDSVLSITITFIMCYMSFFVAEFLGLNISGILATVSCGLFMAAFGKTKIDPEGEHSVHAVWGWVQYACETLIFLLTGCLVGYEVVFTPSSTIDAADWIKMLLFYIFMTVARMIMIMTFYPILTRSGYGLTFREALVVCYGGLRGALGLALALIIGVDDGFPIRMRELVVFHMAGMATITLLLNGTTCASLVRKLGVVSEPEVRSRIRQNFLAELLVSSTKRFEEIKGYKYLNLCDWHKTRKLVGLDDMFSEIKKIDAQGHMNPQELVHRASAYTSFNESEIYAETRFRLLRIMKGLIWEKYEESQLTGDAARLLSEACDFGLDNTSKPIWIWEFLHSTFTGRRSINTYFRLRDTFFIGRFARKYISQHLSFVYQVVTTFMLVAEEVMENHAEIPLSKQHINVVLEEVERNKVDANGYIVSIQDQFSETIKNIQVKRASYNVLHFQRQFLDHALKEGQIEEKEYADIRKQVDRRIIKLEDSKSYGEWSAPTFDDFVMQFPVFAPLRRNEIDKIKSSAQTRVLQSGQPLYTKNTPVEGLFVITKGVVLQQSSDKAQGSKFGLGSILSFGNLINENHIALSSCAAIDQVHAQYIPFVILESIIQGNKDFEEICYKQALADFLRHKPDCGGDLNKLDDQTIAEYAIHGRILRIEENVKFRIENGAFLYHGEVRRCLKEDLLDVNQPDSPKVRGPPGRIRSFTYIASTSDEFVAHHDSIILAFDSRLKEFAISKGRSFRDSVMQEKVSYMLKVSAPQEKAVKRHSIQMSLEHERKIQMELQEIRGKRNDDMSVP